MDAQDYYLWGHQNEHLESQRLTHQHFLCTSLFGGLIQHKIVNDICNREASGPIRVADVACGNGIWSHEVAVSELAEQHNFHVTGFDLSDELFPLKSERPDRVEYVLWNMYDAPAEQYSGTYDIVNVRLVLGAVKQNNPRPILDNLLKLLKPRGWLQWCEIDADNPITSTESAYRRTGEMFRIARGGHSNAWIGDLSNKFEKAGLQTIYSSSKVPEKQMMRYWRDNYFISLGHFVRIANNQKVSEIWEACEKERSELGIRAVWPTVMVVGQKP